MKLWKFSVFQNITKFGLGYIKDSSSLKSTMFVKTSISHLFLFLMLILKLIVLRIMKVRSKDQSLSIIWLSSLSLIALKLMLQGYLKPIISMHSCTHMYEHTKHTIMFHNLLSTYYVSVCLFIYLCMLPCKALFVISSKISLSFFVWGIIRNLFLILWKESPFES